MAIKRTLYILRILTVLSLFSCSISFAQVQTNPEMNRLRITNRAQCAIDSDTPTDSAFLILDGYNAGKLGNSLAKNLELDGSEFSKQTMSEFRLATTHLTLTILNKIMTGKLPLLPENLKTGSLKNYSQSVKACGDKVYCAELSPYLQALWALSERPDISPKSSLWKSIDNFSSSSFYAGRGPLRVGCYYLKRFSPLQGQLHNTALDKTSLEEMAVAYLEREKYIGNCYSQDPTIDSRNVALQIDLKVGAEDIWNKVGFDVWNSAKIYLSWAWRNTETATQMSPRFGQAFKSIALEESMMLIPNGCKSITKPACDSESLAMNSIRELAKSDTRDVEHNAQVPNGVEKNLLERGARSVNNDFLNTRGYMTANEWVDNFRKNYVQTRGSMKNRLQSSVQFMNVLADSVKATELVEFIKPLVFEKSPDNLRRDELYYLCTEIRLAGDKRLDFMKTDIQNIGELRSMSKALENSKRGVQDFLGYFDELSSGVLPMCDQLEKTNLWQTGDYTPNKSGFEAWAKEVLSIPEEASPVPMAPVTARFFGSPLLVWNPSLGSQADNIICASGIDCARKTIKAMVDLYAVAEYAEAFLPISSQASSPSVFNPYSELKACKIYDPWYQTKRANKRFMADLASTALFGWNFMPIYVDADYTPPKVTSFKQLVKNGTIKFDPSLEKSKMVASMVADFGPLAGAPCAVAVSPNAKSFDFLAFDGISVNYCDMKKSNGSQGSGPNDITVNPEKARSYCGGCSINFVGVGSASAVNAANSFNPIKLGVYLFRAIHRFVTAKGDTVNVPQSYSVDLAKVAQVYRQYGNIPKGCINQLGLGLKCEQDLCSARTADFFEQATGGKVSSVSFNEPHDDDRRTAAGVAPFYKMALVKSNVCKGYAMFRVGCSSDGNRFWVSEEGASSIRGYGKTCGSYFKEKRWRN